MNLNLNAEQQSLVVEYRDSWVKTQLEIDALKVEQKEALLALFDKLAYDKENKEEKKSIARGFKIFYKSNQAEERTLTDNALEVAGM